MTFEYKIIETMEGPRYVLHEGDKPIRAPLAEVAICFDIAEGVLHKHGDPELVSKWYNETYAKLKASGLEDWANNLMMFKGPLDINELNKMLNTTGYISAFFKEIHESFSKDVKKLQQSSNSN